MQKTKNGIVAALFVCVVFALINAPAVKAGGGWAGSGGGLGSNCTASDYSLTTYQNGTGLCTYNGYGWVYYRYTDAAIQAYANGENVDIEFGPVSNNSGGHFTIPGVCTEYGGFWHFGIYAYKEIGKTSSLATGANGIRWTRMNIHGYGAFGNPMYGGTGQNVMTGYDEEDNRHNYANYEIVANNVNNAHKFFKNDNPDIKYAYSDFALHTYDKTGRNQAASEGRSYGYNADGTPRDSEKDVWLYYEQYQQVKYEKEGIWDTQWDIADRASSTITAFCSGYEIGTPIKGATFDGEVTVSVSGNGESNGAIVQVGAEAKTVTFTHKIERTDDSDLPVTATNIWSTSVWSTPNSNPHGVAASGSTDFKKRHNPKVVREDSFTVTLSEGQQITYCQNLQYIKSINYQTNIGTNAIAGTCVTLYRPETPPPTAGTFEPKMSCTTIAADMVKSTECNTNSDTNSKKWSISHTSWVKSNNSSDVNAGRVAASPAPYTHDNLQYGIDGVQCVRSHGAYTHYNRYIDSIGGAGVSASESDITLRQTNPKEQDLPTTAVLDDPEHDNYHDTGELIVVGYQDDPSGATEINTHSETRYYPEPGLWHDPVYDCVWKGYGLGTYPDSACSAEPYTGIFSIFNAYSSEKVSDGWYQKSYIYTWTTEDPVQVPVMGPKMDWYIPGCDSGKTYWYEFDNKMSTKTWSNDNDSSLLLGSTNDKVSVNRCSALEVTPNYSNGYWSGSATVSSCNQVTRWRRYAHFNAGTLGIKADPGTHSAATSSKNNGDTIDTSNNDGYFTVTFTYSLDRGNTDNYKDGDASKNFKVKNRWSSMESVAAADGSGLTYLINGNYDDWHEYGTFESTNANTPNVAGTKTETITGQLYYGQKIKICGHLSYGDIVKETDSGSKRSHIIEQDNPQEVGCIYVSRGENNCSSVVGNSSQIGYSYGHQTGHNVAMIGVINASTNMTSPLFTTWNYNQSVLNRGSEASVGVWARPGDSIRYQVKYCMGANYSHSVHLLNGIADGGEDTKMKMYGASTAITATDTNKLTQKQQSNYLFGDTVATYNDATKETTPIEFNFTKYTTITNDDGSTSYSIDPTSITGTNNIGTKYSPDLTGSANLKLYSCPNGGNNSNAVDNYYQIAGKVRRNGAYRDSDNYSIDGCGTNRTQALDVGRQLSEQLTWTNMRINNATSATADSVYSHRAYVRVPYNYVAKPYLENNSNPTGTVQIGGKMSTTPGIAVLPRKNCAFVDGYYSGGLSQAACRNSNSSAATYATVTKPTTVTFETLINNVVLAGSGKTIVVRANTQSYRNGSKDVAQNTESGGGPTLDDKYIIDVPNTANPGDKICIRMTISPADSHNSPTSSLVWGASVDNSYAENTNSNGTVWWGLRESAEGTTYAQSSATVTTCSTAVKRPTMSVEDSNLYTATSVATSVVARTNNNTQYFYGSWTEYGIFGKVITSATNDIGTLGMGSGASYGYNQTSFYSAHSGPVSGYNPQPLTIVTYNGGPKNGVHKYNYATVTTSANQRQIVYNYARNDDGSHSYQLVSNNVVTIGPSIYSFTNMPIVNAGNSVGSAKKSSSTVCVHSTQTFANSNCDSGQVGTSGVGSDAAESFTTNLLGHYDTNKVKESTVAADAPKYGDYVNITSTKVSAGQIEGDENAAMYKYVKKAFFGYEDGSPVNLATLPIKQAESVAGETLNLSTGSVIIFKATNLVINSSIIANNDEKNNAGDFRMPIIIADRVWLTGNPTQIDAIIITNELNTCKWNSFNDFKNSTTAGTVNMSTLASDVCTKTVRFTAPVVVKGKVYLNRTAGAGAGDDQIRRAEIFELSPATYLWSFAEASRYSQAITTYSRELPSRY